MGIVNNKASATGSDLLRGGGELGEMIRNRDWSKTPLGPIETWPQSLKTVVHIMLNSRQPIWIGWGPQLIKLYNDPYKAIVGGKHPQALGQPASVVWHDIWQNIEPMLRQVMEKNEGTYVESELLIMERNGYPEETYYTFSYNPVPSDEGGVGGMFCTNTDDTQRVIGERQLALLRSLGAAAADAQNIREACDFAAKSLENNPKDLIFAMLYLVEPEENSLYLAGLSGISKGHPVAPETVPLGDNSLWPFEEALKTGKPVLIDLAQRAGDENPYIDLPAGAWLRPPRQAMVVPIVQSGDTGKAGLLIIGLNPFRQLDEGYHGFIRLVAGQIASSIANARAHEEERRRAEALAEIDRAKTTFFSNVSHEFRTPLTLMLGPIEDSLNDEQSLPRNRERMQLAHRNAIRLLKLVNALLDFSQIEAGRMQAIFEPLDLAAYTADLASGFRSAIEKAGMELVVDCPPLDAPVYADREMWEKIVLNLLSNAFKYTLRGKISVGLKRNGQMLELSVSDTGAGIPEEELPHMFERFHRVKGTEGRTHEGTGIGLSLVHELVKMHSGTIEVKSMLGKGSTFTVAIPLGVKHLPKDKISAHPARAATGTTGHAYMEEALRWLPGNSDIFELISDVPAPSSASLLPQILSTGEERPSRILLADDNADMREYMKKLLGRHFEVESVADGREALAVALANPPDLVLTDIMMPHLDGFGLLKRLRAEPATRTIPIIMLSARAGEEARIEGVAAGADDYLVKPFCAKELVARVSTHLEMARIRKQAQSAAEEERKRLFELFMQAPAFIAVLRGSDHVFELANPMYMQVIGQNRTVIGKTVEEALPEIKSQGFLEILDQVYRTGIPFVANERPVKLSRKGDGGLEELFLNFVYQPFVDSAGRVQGIFVHGMDVSDQVQNRKIVEQSEERFRNLAESMPQLVWTTGPDGTPDYVNQNWYNYTGVAPGQNMNMNWGQALHPDDKDAAAKTWREAVASGNAMSMEYRLKNREGNYRWFLARGIPQYDQEGKIVKWFGTSTDIEEQKKALEQKDEFMSIASHELKTPITSIKAAVQIANALAKKQNTEKIVNFLNKAEKQIDKLTGLVGDLLDVSRIKTGKLAFRYSDFDLAEVIEDCVEQASHQPKRHRIITQVEPGIRLTADKMRLEQVISNLLSNAVKYSPQADKVMLTASREGSQVKLAVTDFGIGIPKDKQALIFDRYYRAQENAHQFQGLGLGLYISSEIIKRHSGRIWVESEEGKGTTFYFILPLKNTTDHAGG